MTVKISYKNNIIKNIPTNYVIFVEENFHISDLKKKISKNELSFVLDLLKSKDLKKKLIVLDINSKKKIILVSLKKNIKATNIENLGAKLYDMSSDTKYDQFNINSDSIDSKLKNLVGHFVHGFVLKSYQFEKYKSKKSKKNIQINISGHNKPSLKDQIKFKAIEQGTFYTRDLVSEPGNILHPDEYTKRLKTLKKDG